MRPDAYTRPLFGSACANFGRGAALSSTVDLGGAGSPMRGMQRGLLIGCWVMSDGPPDRPFGTVIPGRARVFENCRGRRENV